MTLTPSVGPYILVGAIVIETICFRLRGGPDSLFQAYTHNSYLPSPHLRWQIAAPSNLMTSSFLIIWYPWSDSNRQHLVSKTSISSPVGLQGYNLVEFVGIAPTYLGLQSSARTISARTPLRCIFFGTPDETRSRIT
jgi:hypothetical protein